MKEMKLADFKEYVKKYDKNVITEDEGIFEPFSKTRDSFSIVCKKCGSMNIEMIGEDGINYGELTGYQEGTNVIKCKDCGNAITIYK